MKRMVSDIMSLFVNLHDNHIFLASVRQNEVVIT